MAVSAILVVFGAGFGMVGQVLTVAIQNGVEPRDIGVATGSANLFRALGGSIGVAVFGAIFAGRLDGSAGSTWSACRRPRPLRQPARPVDIATASPTRCRPCS